MNFFVQNLKNSITLKVTAYNLKTLDEAYGFAMNFEREVKHRIEKSKDHLGKRSLKLNASGNSTSKATKFSKTSRSSQFSKFKKGDKLGS